MKVYHLSPYRNRDYINQVGLIANSRMCGPYTHGQRVCVSLSLNDLAFKEVGRRNVDLWSIEIDEKIIQQDEHSPKDYYVEQNIKKEFIKLEKSF